MHPIFRHSRLLTMLGDEGAPSFESIFGLGAAAYSAARQLSTASTAIVRVRRSSDNAEQDFTASQVNGSGLLDFVVPSEVQAKYNDAMYFDGVDDAVVIDTPITFTSSDTFSLKGKFIFSDLLGGSGTGLFGDSSVANTGLWLGNTGQTIGFTNDAGAFSSRGLTGAPLTDNVEYEVEISNNSGDFSLQIDGVERLLSTLAISDFTIDQFGLSRARRLKGVMFDVVIVKNGTTYSYNGDDNTDTGWEDQTGNNDGTVNGSPALFTGQGFDGFVTTLYDQRVATSQDRMQFDDTGSEKRVTLDSEIDFSTGNFRIKDKAVFNNFNNARNVLLGSDTDNEWLMSFDNPSTFSMRESTTPNTIRSLTIDGTLSINTEYEFELQRVGNTISLSIDGVVQANTITCLSSSTYAFQTFGGKASINDLEGTTFDIEVYNFSDVLIHSYQGYSNLSEGWLDNTGSNNGNVEGNPQRVSQTDFTALSNDAVQATAANQPLLVKEGALVTEGSRPALSFDGVDDELNFEDDSVFRNVAYAQVFTVAQSNTDDGNGRIVSVLNGSGTNARFLLGEDDTGVNPQVFRLGGRRLDADSFQEIISNTQHSNEQKVLTALINYTDAEAYLYQDGALVASADPFQTAGNSTNSANGGTDNGIGHFGYDGTVSEVIVYETDQTSNRTVIENNINNFYGVY